MSFIQWQSWQILNRLSRSVEEVLANFPAVESSVWVGSDDSAWVSDITIHETATEMVLRIQMPSALDNLEVQISPETAVIQGKPLEYQVEGYFNVGLVPNLIPLPIAVHPDAVQAELHTNTLILILPKSGSTQRQRIAVQFSQDDRCLDRANLSNAKSCR